MAPIDRAALRAVAEAATPGPWRTGTGDHHSRDVHRAEPADVPVRDVAVCGGAHGHADARYIAAAAPDVVLCLLDALDAAERERDAYKRAKAENDERFMCERDAARVERDQARADLVRYGEHGPGCWDGRPPRDDNPCDCGYAEALARAEGR